MPTPGRQRWGQWGVPRADTPIPMGTAPNALGVANKAEHSSSKFPPKQPWEWQFLPVLGVPKASGAGGSPGHPSPRGWDCY